MTCFHSSHIALCKVFDHRRGVLLLFLRGFGGLVFGLLCRLFCCQGRECVSLRIKRLEKFGNVAGGDELGGEVIGGRGEIVHLQDILKFVG